MQPKWSKYIEVQVMEKWDQWFWFYPDWYPERCLVWFALCCLYLRSTLNYWTGTETGSEVAQYFLPLYNTCWTQSIFSPSHQVWIYFISICVHICQSHHFFFFSFFFFFFFFKLHFALAEESAPGSIWDFSLLQNFLFNHHVRHFGNCQKVCHLVYLGTCIVHAKKSQSLEHSGHKRLKICRKHKE